MSLILKKVDEDNYREIVSLKVAKGQETFIESTQECLDEAKELSLWRTVGVYDKNTLIGFAMYGFFESEGVDGRVWLDRFMIGHEHQGKGYSNRSLNLLISHISKEYNCEEIFLSVYDDNTVAIKIYEKLGFKFNGEVDTKGEKIMVIELSKDNMQIKIRKELEKDFNTVETIVEEAFKNAEFSDHSEHELVGRLRKSNEFINELSLVAKVNEEMHNYPS